ncbi:MAG: hypothetical protein L3J41_17395 [Melioribacteraceae bacterium]|nr:hypothetical protein [Melioribacteraceae bacterium]
MNVYIIEEVDEKYVNCVICTSYKEAEKIVKAAGGNFTIVSSYENDDYFYL